MFRDPKTGNLFKTEDPSWPRCSCGRCVYEDMEFPIYYGEDENDPHVRDFAKRIMERKRRWGTPEFADGTEDEEIQDLLAMGIGTDECFNCGEVFLHSEKRWTEWEEPDIQFEITHYYRPLMDRDEEWRPLSFVTREVGTEEPFFQGFTTWRVMSREHLEDHERSGRAIRLSSPLHPLRGSTMWMTSDDRLWISPTGDHTDGLLIVDPLLSQELAPRRMLGGDQYE